MSDQLEFDEYQRWRLILGKRVEDQTSQSRQQGGCGEKGEKTLSPEMERIDAALGALYDNEDDASSGDPSTARSKKRSAGLGAGKGRIADWLGDIRKYFDTDVVVMLQQDAIDRKGLKELLFEPETLAQVQPSIEMVATLMSLKNMIPEQTKDTARLLVKAVVEEIMRWLLPALQQAIRGALNRSRHQPIPSLPNLDWKRTIQLNLKNYYPAKKTIIPDRFFFYARQQRQREWNIIVCMDQSGSMAESVVYGSIMGAIFASLPSIESHVVAFDTEVVDLTNQSSDPVDMIFGVQLGGGTDINRAVKYCQDFIHDPKKTLFILITDLYEGGNQRELVRRMGEMTESGVRALCMLALSDSGVPCYDEGLARSLRNLGVPCFGCTPKMLPRVLEAALKGQTLDPIIADQKSK